MNWKIRFKLSVAFRPLNALLRGWRQVEWRLRGAKLPPPHEIKQANLLGLRRRFGPKVFVETGTYRGKMIFAMRPYFDRIVSIEVDSTLGQRAKQTFADCPEVEVVIGDSAEQLPAALERLREPALFWLDGHYSGGETGQGAKLTPILEELDAIFRHPVPGHVIAVDDALAFTGEHDYPTIEGLAEFVAQRAGHYRFDVSQNIIFISPPAVAG